MEDVSVLKNASTIRNKTHETNIAEGKLSRRITDFDLSGVNLIAEGGLNFLRYLKSLGMSRENNLVILSSKHHYYYDANDLKSVRILINLKKMNLIKYLDLFLNTLVRILPQNASFIGCFSDSSTLKRNGFSLYHPSMLYSRFINFLDSRTDNILNKNEITELLERNGFKTIDMKEMNGLTYFHCKMSGSTLN